MVIKNLARKEIYQLRWLIIIGILLSAGTAAITVASFHYVEQIVEEIPLELIELLSQYEVTRELLFIFGDYSLFVWSQWNAKNFFQLAALFTIIIAATQFAGEVSKKTISFYLTRPVSRRHGYVGKIAAGLLVIIVVFTGGTVLFWLSSLIMGYTAEWGRLFAAMLIGLVWVSVYYLLACIISLLNREPVMAGMIIGISGVLLSLPGMFTLSRQYSIFYQMRAVDYYLLGQPLLLSIVPGVVIGVLLLLIGLRVFEKKDY